MNIRDVLEKTVVFFATHGVPEPRLDAEVLLAHTLGMERIQLYVNYDLPLKTEELSRFRQLVKDRARRIPVAYLLGEKEFMSLKLEVNKYVLIPRPETELLVEEVLNYCQTKDWPEIKVVDVGTGSGAIIVSLAYYHPQVKALGIDISPKALEVAQRNIRKFGLEERVKLRLGDLLQPLIKLGKNNLDIIVSNPPYISKKGMEQLPPEVKKEPAKALFGGKDGLDYYRRLIPQAQKLLKPGGLLALEIGFDQGKAVKGFLPSPEWKVCIKKDYAGHDRIVLAELE